MFAELQGDLDRIWKAPAVPRRGWWALVRSRIPSLGLVVSIGFLLLVSLILSAALAALKILPRVRIVALYAHRYGSRSGETPSPSARGSLHRDRTPQTH